MADIGVAYAESLPAHRTALDCSKINFVACRMVLNVQGNEAGAGKGIQAYDSTNAQALCEKTWDGAAVQRAIVGAWTKPATIPTTDITIQVREKASSVTEDLTIYKAELQVLIV